MTTPTGTPAGWYPDEEGGGLRYWDGNAWTDHRADSAPAADGPVAAAPAETVQSEYVSVSSARRAERERRLDAAQDATPVYRRKPVLIGAAVVAALVLLVALVLAVSGGDGSDDAETPMANPAATTEPLEQLIVVAPGTTTIEAVATTIKCGTRSPALVRPQGATDASVCKVGGKDVVIIAFPSGAELGAWVSAIGDGAKVSGAPAAGANVGLLINDEKTAAAARKALGG